MKYLSISIGLILALLLFSCSKDTSIMTGGVKKDVQFTITDFDFEQSSRTAVDITDKAVVFTWTVNDTVGVFPDTDASQARFVMTAGAGTKTATFDGGGWALMADKKYASYYPYIPDANLDKTRIPVSYAGQIQNGNGNTSHLGAYDYMAATAIVPTDGEVAFNYKHLGCLMQFKLTMPKSGTFTALSLKSQEKIFASEGRYNLMESQIAIEPTSLLDSIHLGLNNVQTNAANQVLTVYLMMAPGHLSGKEIAVRAWDKDRMVAEGTALLKDFVAGTAYSLETSLNEKNDHQEEEGVTNITTAI